MSPVLALIDTSAFLRKAHRAAGPVDLVIAATAERHRLTVLCDDHDFETVSAVTGQPVKLVGDI